MKFLKILTLLAVSVMLIGLVACPSSQPSDTGGPRGDVDADTPPDVDTPPDTVQPVDTPEEVPESNVTETEGIPDGWPDSIPMMDGLTVVSGGIGTGDNDFDLGVYASGEMSFDEVAEFYGNLEGWTLNEDLVAADPSTATVGFSNDAGDILIIRAEIKEEGAIELGFVLSYAEEEVEEEPETE